MLKVMHRHYLQSFRNVFKITFTKQNSIYTFQNFNELLTVIVSSPEKKKDVSNISLPNNST